MPRLPENVALLRAAEHGSVEIVSFLLRNGFVINDYFEYGPRDNSSPFVPSLRSPLRMAIRSGNSEVVAFLLRNGAYLNTSRLLSDHKRGVSELHLAAEYGRADIAEMLLRHGAKPEKPCSASHHSFGWGISPPFQAIHLAANKGHLDVVALLLRHGIPVDVTAMNETALQLAARRGHLPLVKFLVDRAGAGIEGAIKQSTPPLLSALSGGHTQVARYLIQSGANVQAKTYYGLGALHTLARSGANDLDLTRELIRRGVSVTARDQDKSETPLSLAIRHSSVDMVHCLLEHGADVNRRCSMSSTPLSLAAQLGRTDLVKYLTSRGADQLDQSDKDIFKLPIHYLACNGDLEGVRWVVENGGVPDLINRFTYSHRTVKSPLHFAAEHRHTKLASYLVSAGADVNALDQDEHTPLHAAICSKARAVVALLLQNGAMLNAPGSDSTSSMLHWAARYGGMEVVALLLKYGADISARDEEGSTPFHIAAGHASRETLMFLLRKGSDPHAINNQGQSPLHYAAQRGLKHAVDILLNHGADPSVSCHKGLTPLHYADAVRVDARVAWSLLKAAGLNWLEPVALLPRYREV